ncbi:MAG: TetR family transcriptional regulator [Myxococcales bacterium]|nr:TetR family transcriptional regulator [Myxococcales bacterium]
MTTKTRASSKRATARKPRRGRPPKGASTLSREAITRAALEAIDGGGLEAVSLRVVARRLGVDPSSLYNHVASKDDLLDAVAEHILATFEVPAPTGALEDDLRAIGRAFRRHALEHANATVLVLTRPTISAASLGPLEAILAVLVGAGCTYDKAVHLLRVFMATMLGSVLRDASLSAAFDGEVFASLVRRGAALEASGLEHIVAAAPHLASFDGDAEFDFAVRLATAAIAAELGDADPRKGDRP